MFPCITTTPMLATYSQKCHPGKETSTEFGSCIFHPVQFWRTDSQKHSLNKWLTWRYTVELKERTVSLHYLPYSLSFLFYIFHSHFTAFTYQGFSSWNIQNVTFLKKYNSALQSIQRWLHLEVICLHITEKAPTPQVVQVGHQWYHRRKNIMQKKQQKKTTQEWKSSITSGPSDPTTPIKCKTRNWGTPQKRNKRSAMERLGDPRKEVTSILKFPL